MGGMVVKGADDSEMHGHGDLERIAVLAFLALTMRGGQELDRVCEEHSQGRSAR
jgi:hypothetical protein